MLWTILAIWFLIPSFSWANNQIADNFVLMGQSERPYTFTIIAVPGATLTEVYGINSAGQIVGRFDDAAGIRHGFLKDGDTFITMMFLVV